MKTAEKDINSVASENRSDLNNPELYFKQEVKDMFDLTIEMLSLSRQGFNKLNRAKLSQSLNYGKQIHNKEKKLTNNLVIKLTNDKELFAKLQGIDLIPSHLERIGDNIELLVRCTSNIIDEGLCFSEKAIREINTLFEIAEEMIRSTRDASITKNEFLINHINEENDKFGQMVSEFSQWHYDRLIEGICTPKSSSAYLALLDYLSEILKHIRLITQRIN
ncbi:MAG: hypothetical protein GWO07_02540 [Candidatus Dadabacteria bacterium]|nr:hypothetical protein [Candidatus Dadabacteria bacterium]NIS07645.1 hypothetical protein [Candidatus Dadabacteria bacterium]NIV42116.1 hypothetical protein [Candidatus Dadabacteria bacterium]NIX14740.1 hypothetical protein [Candidatus Dadabacteria bacterium]NIY21283.1 hypothetical protein [Candidatus Dadabacteria bacterium]